MNKYAYFGVGCGVGGLLGVAFTYIFVKKRLEEKNREEINEVKDALIAQAKEKPDKIASKTGENAVSDDKHDKIQSKVNEKLSKKPVTVAQSSIAKTEIIQEPVNYGSYFASGEDLDDEDDPFEEEMAEKEAPIEHGRVPYIVPRDGEDGIWGNPSIDVITCTLYLGGNEKVLVEDTDPNQLAMDIFSTVGGPDWEKFVADKDDDDRLFVDPRTGIVYEISKDDSDYKQVMEDYYGGQNL